MGGGMAERTIAMVLKTIEDLGSPGVQIPLPPPQKFLIFKIRMGLVFCNHD